MTQTTQADLEMMRFEDLKARRIAKDRKTIKRWEAELGFPAAVRLGKRSIAWRAFEVEAWLQRRAQRTEGAA